jgi:putative adhesin
MLTILRNLLCLFALVVTASAATEENISRQLDVTPGGKLVVDVDFGTINVTAGADDKVVIEAYRKIDFGDEAKEKEYFAAAPVVINQDGSVVTVGAHHTKSKGFWSFGHSEMDGRYTIRVPKRFEADLQTEGGAVTAGEITGSVTAKTSGGKLAFEHLEGTLTGNTSGGSIEVEDCRGPIEIETSGGDIIVADGTGTLNAKTSGGRIDVRNFSGDTEVRTSGGNLSLQRITGRIIGKTSGGSIRASISDAVVGDVRLETSAGNIDFSLPATATVDIDASTSVGEIFSRLPLETSDVDEEHLRGKLNGGGKSVKLETSAGNITLKPSSSEIASR